MHKFLRARTREDGFTMIELLVVVIIIAILAAIAVPVYIGIQNNSKRSSLQHDVDTNKTAIAAALAEDQTVNAGTSSAEVGVKLLRSGTPADELITVKRNGDQFKVTASSASLNIAYTYDSATAQTTASDPVTALGATPTYLNVWTNTKRAANFTPFSSKLYVSLDTSPSVYGGSTWTPAYPGDYNFKSTDVIKVSGDYDFMNGVFECSKLPAQTNAPVSNVVLYTDAMLQGPILDPGYATANTYTLYMTPGCGSHQFAILGTGTITNAAAKYPHSVKFDYQGKTYAINYFS